MACGRAHQACTPEYHDSKCDALNGEALGDDDRGCCADNEAEVEDRGAEGIAVSCA